MTKKQAIVFVAALVAASAWVFYCAHTWGLNSFITG